MNGRRAIVGLCMLCALLVSAFAAQSASAITGTTAFTCSKGAGTLRGEHCLSTGTAAAEYGHVAIAQDKTTELTGTNAKSQNNTTEVSPGFLKVTIGGVPLEFEATGVSGSGWMENKLAASGEHYAHGKGTITFTGIKVLQPERECDVYTHNENGKGEAEEKGEVGVVHTRELTATTEGQQDFLKFEAADKGDFARFWVFCKKAPTIPAIEGTWTCNGSVKAVPNGATSTFTHAEVTAQNTLKCRGTKAGITGSLTLSSREKGSGGAYTPLAATTVTT